MSIITLKYKLFQSQFVFYLKGSTIISVGKDLIHHERRVQRF